MPQAPLGKFKFLAQSNADCHWFSQDCCANEQTLIGSHGVEGHWRCQRKKEDKENEGEIKRKHYKNRRGDGEKRARDLESNKLEKDLRRQGAEL